MQLLKIEASEIKQGDLLVSMFQGTNLIVGGLVLKVSHPPVDDRDLLLGRTNGSITVELQSMLKPTSQWTEHYSPEREWYVIRV